MNAKVEITGLNHEGDGVGRLDNQVVFVPQTAPGDIVEIKIVDRRKSFLRGEVEKILRPSPDRIAPQCPHALECGGCQFQHISYEAQLRWKRQQVEDALQRIGHLDAEVLDVIGMDEPQLYRNKAQFPVGEMSGDVVMGFFRKGTHVIVNMKQCLVQHPLIEKLAHAVRGAVQKLGIEPYNEESHAGLLRHAVIRTSFSEKKLMLVLVTTKPEIPHLDELISLLSSEVPELGSICQNINSRVTNVIFGPETRVLWGEPYLYEHIGELRYAISPRSFFQVNPVQTKVLYDLVKKRADLRGNETVLDLYCGAGTIGLYVARLAKKVVGVETIPDAIADARLNAALNSITNAEFFVGRAEKVVPELVHDVGRIDRTILDPPRKGCDQVVLDTLIQANVPRIIYVSCNPSTLARDMAYLHEHGYQHGPVQPVDMFPWTRHVECVVLMSRVEK